MRCDYFVPIICVCTIFSSAQEPVSLSEARMQEFGSIVTRVAGRVTAAGQFRNTSFIQDGTGGIAVFNSTFSLGVQIGDSVIIDSAQLTEFNQTAGIPGSGLTELTGAAFRFTVVPTPRIEPSPRTTALPNIAESLEGQLVRIRNVKFIEQGTFQGETSYRIVDENDVVFPIRIDAATEIASNTLSIPVGFVNLIGVVSQFQGTYQILPRISADVGITHVENDTVSRNRTIDIASWNLNWYGSSDTSKGPIDKDRQQSGIRRVLDSMNVDLIAVQEVLSQESLAVLTDSLDGEYSNLFAIDISSSQKMAYLYNTATITPESYGLAVNGGSKAWAGGRFPFRFTFTITIDGTAQRLVVFNIHAKATDSATAMEDYSRRKTDAETFHTYLADFYSDANVIVTGDFNDNLLGSVVDTVLDSPYLSFLTDTASWKSTTYALEQSGLATYIGGFRSFIDHFLISNELAQSEYRTYIESPQAYLSSYSSTVSDHLPVTMRLWPSGATSLADEEPESGILMRISPNPCTDRCSIELTLEHETNVKVVLADATGNVMQLLDETLSPQIRVISIPVTYLASGFYYVVVRSNNSVFRQPFVVSR